MAKARERETEAPTQPARGVYAVKLDGCPRRSIDTGLPAGPAAEAVARDRYLRDLRLAPRPGLTPDVTLEG